MASADFPPYACMVEQQLSLRCVRIQPPCDAPGLAVVGMMGTQQHMSIRAIWHDARWCFKVAEGFYI